MHGSFKNRSGWLGLLFGLFCLAACRSNTFDVVNGSAQLSSISIASPALFIGAEEAGAFLAREAGLSHLTIESSEKAVALYGPDGRNLGRPRLITPRTSTGPFVVAGGGLFYFDRGVLVASPASQLLPSEIAAIEEAPNGDVYFAAHDGLYVNSQGSLQRVDNPEQPIAGPLLAMAALSSPTFRIFVVSAKVVTSFDANDSSLRQAPLDGDFRWLARSGEEVMVGTSRGVFRISLGNAQLTLEHLEVPLLPRLVASTPKGAYWLSNQGLAHVQGLTSTSLTLTPDDGIALDPSTITAMATDPLGTLWLLSDSRVYKVSRERTLPVAGLRPGESVLGTIYVRAFPANPTTLSSFTFRLGDVTQTQMDPPFDLGGRNGAGDLAGVDTNALDSGAHTLELEAKYQDGEVVSRSIPFKVERVLTGTPTYATHISPIYQSRCAKCHIAGAAARDLDGVERWRTNLDQIIDSVEQKRMPVDMPLPPELIDVIVRWKAAGAP